MKKMLTGIMLCALWIGTSTRRGRAGAQGKAQFRSTLLEGKTMKPRTAIQSICALATTALVLASPAAATIISGQVTGGQALTQGGIFVKLLPPFTDSEPDNTVGDDNFQTPNLYAFDEGQNIDVSADLSVDILAGGAGSGVVPAGSTVASHYVFFDPSGYTSQTGTVTFDSDIFGIITGRTNLGASDFLVNTGVNYLNPSNRGLESGDDVSLVNLRTIALDWSAGAPGDYIRVLTDFSPGAEVPLPAGFWLIAPAVGLLAPWVKRRKIAA